MSADKILSRTEMANKSKELREAGKILIATSGCFDILHAGHVAYLEDSRTLGDALIVFLNSDASVHRLKGLERPVVKENDRALVLAGLACVDYVCVFDEDTPCEVISAIQPQIFVKGGDYKGRRIPEMDVMESYGGYVKYGPELVGRSTTNIINKMRANSETKQEGKDD